jgi:hypothetical protein
MKFKSGFLVGLGAGYVLGAKAGEERYQQIVEAAKSLRENPGVQRLSGEVNRTVAVGKDRVGEAASRKAEQAADAAAAQASALRLVGDDDPQGQVQHQARAAEYGQHDEQDPDQGRVDVEVLRQAAADAGQLAIGSAPVQLAGLGHGGALSRGSCGLRR